MYLYGKLTLILVETNVHGLVGDLYFSFGSELVVPTRKDSDFDFLFASESYAPNFDPLVFLEVNPLVEPQE